MSTTVIDLIRHGEPRGGRRFRGHRDDPLSARGWAQMRAALAGGGDWEVVVSSPLARCAAFAERFAAERGLAWEVHPGLREVGFGAWEGLRPGDVEARFGAALQRFWDDPVAFTPPQAEPFAEFAERAAAAWQEVLDRHAGRRVLLVGHGGLIRVILAGTLGAPLQSCFRLQVPYAAVSRIQVDDHPVHGRLQALAFLNGHL